LEPQQRPNELGLTTAPVISRLAPQVEQDRTPAVFVYQPQLAGHPLVSHEVIVNSSLQPPKRECAWEPQSTDTPCEKGIKVTDAEFTTIRITPDDFHGDWKYAICPHPKIVNVSLFY